MSNEKIRRAPHNQENPYAQISRAMLQDKSITYEAKGLLGYLLSKPNDWTVQPKDLEQEGTGRDRVYRILKELIENGYIERIYNRNDSGVILSVEYLVHEMPFPEKPDQAKPDTANTDITEEREEHNTKLTDRLAQEKLDQAVRMRKHTYHTPALTKTDDNMQVHQRQPQSELEAYLAKLAKCRGGVLPYKLVEQISMPIKIDGIDYDSPVRMYYAEPLFKQWLSERIAWAIDNTDMSARALVGLARLYDAPKYGWLAYQNRESAENADNTPNQESDAQAIDF